MELKKKRGRPRKIEEPLDLEKIEEITQDIKEKEDEEIHEMIQELKKEHNEWDYPIGRDVPYFDPKCSYELSGYKPIDGTHGLDFDPSWFTEASTTYNNTNRFCSFVEGSKAWHDFWELQYKRMRNGMTVNGYTITGDHYYFLNFYRLNDLTSATKSGSGRKQIFPRFCVAQYEYFHYLELCKQLKKDAIGLKARGVGFSEIAASLVTNTYHCRKNSLCLITAQQQVYVEKTFAKVVVQLNFGNEHSLGGLFKLRQKKDTALNKKASIVLKINGQEVESGWGSELNCIVADKPNKIRGDRTDVLLYEESGCHIAGTEVIMYDGNLKKVEDIQIGDLVMGDDGTSREVIELHSGTDQMYKITPTNGEPQIVNSKHIIYGKKKDYYRHTYNDFTITAEDYYNLIKDAPRKSDGYKLIKSNSIYFNHLNVPIDPYLFGFWLGDGNSDKFRFTSNDIEIWEYLKEVALKENLEYRETLCTNTKSCKHIYLSNHNKINPLWSKFRTLGVVNNKHIPNIYKFNSREILLQLLAGLIDSDGTYNKKKHEVLFTQYEGRELLVHDFAYICRSLGMRVSEDVRISKERILDGKIIKGGVKQYRCSILYGHSEIPTKILRKQTTDRDNSKDRMACTFKIEPYKIDKYYGFSLTGNLLFLLKDFTICHNSWPSWKKAYLQGEALVEDQGSKFGIRLAWGPSTGGDSGPALAGLADAYKHPDIYGALPYLNRFTASGQDEITAYFIPSYAYLNVPGYIDKRGWCEPVRAKSYMEEHVRKPKINDKEAYLICCAETCFNADEALALEGDNKFNKVLLSHQLALIEILQECPKIETGEFQFKYVHGTERTAKNVSGVKWVPGNNGLVHILEHPVWEGNSENLRAEMNNLYVAGIDSIDIGLDQTSDATKNPSKFAIIIKKRALGLDSPKYVAYYKYRPRDEREAYETAMKLMIYYNCKANIEATRLTMLNWAKTRGWTNYFMRRPKATYADAHRKISNTIGTPATTPIINHQTDLIALYVEDYSLEIWFPEILHEFLRYSDATKGEFDLTAAAGMVELADEELSGVVPTNVEKEEESTWKEIGYYKDEQGVTHWGVISKNNLLSRARISTEIEDNRLYGHSSDPRYYE